MRERNTVGQISDDDAAHLQVAALWASAANTIPAAFWALAHILADPAAKAAITAEVLAGDFDPARRLPLLESAICEALRLSSASLTLRRVTRDLALPLGGVDHALRAGDLVCIFPYLTHRDRDIHPDPERFRHDRFMTRQFFKNGRKVGFAFVPFGGGVSMCPGRHLASEEIKVFLALMLRRFELDLDGPLPERNLRRSGIGIMPPVGDVGFRYRIRGAGA
jgi:cytochrome P450